ncbi:unnamed protein product [Chondrus crispus]|uniref:MYND-type domain-containing protein n=1 Tax=Chondrus crispus TaxID=2769 RepID=R7QKP3_CHOCR|nr:unnamed protein product [Chondrus crispus]CDF37965.1 unnamed protein product [Chondrus crispus]|eukprot:XP_005717834.1 unnamed protein product [Chondrus crispus]
MAPPPLPAELLRKLEAAQRVEPPSTRLAYQVLAIQLRVWLADQNDVACRPWYILIAELYPRGKVINQRVHSPAAQKPGPAALLHFLADHILCPPEGEAARPTHVSFIEDAVTDALKPTLTKLRIEAGTLIVADGIAEYTKLFSNKMINMNKATRGDAAERPGILSVRGLTPSVAGEMCAAAKEMFRARPWSRIAEHIALEIRLPTPDPGHNYRDRYYVTVLGSAGNVQGFALMPSLTKLREKYRRAVRNKGEALEEVSDDEEGDGAFEGARKGHSVSRTMDDVLLCGACGKRVGEATEGDGAKYVDRCGGCRRLLYCNERCQKLDWRERHKDECQQATSDAEYVFKRDEWAWLQRELALLFLDPTAIPFDDLDAAETYKWDYIEEVSPPLHPLPFVTVEGTASGTNRMDRPTVKEFGFMTLIAKALTECVSPPPDDGTLHLASGVSISVAENLKESLPATL